MKFMMGFHKYHFFHHKIEIFFILKLVGMSNYII